MAGVAIDRVGFHVDACEVDSSLYSEFVARARRMKGAPGKSRLNILIGYDATKDIEQTVDPHEGHFRPDRLSVTRPVDLVIRSGGHRRLSGFLPLMCQYADLEFIDELFPDISVDQLVALVRQRTGQSRNHGA